MTAGPALDPEAARRLRSWLDRYEEALRTLLASEPGAAAQTALDACFAAMRLQQRAHWPSGAAVLDMLGLCLHALLQAWTQDGAASPRFESAMARHALCCERLRSALGDGA